MPIGSIVSRLTPLITILGLSVPILANQNEPTPGADYSSEPFVVEDDTAHITFENDGTAVREETFQVRIQSDAGLQRYSVLTLAYQGAQETVEVQRVRVQKPDGTFVDTPGGDVQDMPAAITREAPFYSDLREKHIAVKGLGIGDVVEMRAVWRLTKPIVPGQFWLSVQTPTGYVIRRFRVVVSTPRERVIKWSSPTVQPTISEEGSRRIFTWSTSQLTPTSSKESAAAGSEGAKNDQAKTGPKKARPGLEISTFASWEAVGEWYRSLARDRAKPSAEVRAKAAALTKDLASEEAQVHAIYNYVSTQVRYVGVAFGIGRYQPHEPAEVLSNQYGDCKDKHTLLQAMLSAIGVKAYPALIHDSNEIDEAVASPGQFDHVITAIPRGSGYTWLDSTTEVSPFGYLTSNLRGKRVLVIPDDRPAALVTTDADPPARFLESYRMDAALGETGTLEGTADCSFRGNDNEVLLRAAFRRTSMAQWKDVVQLISYRAGFGGEVSDVRVDGATDAEQPVHWRYKYSRKDYPDWSDRKIRLPFPLLSMPPAPDKPTEPLRLGSPGEMHYEASVKLPKGSAPQVPPRRELKETFADYFATYEVKDGAVKAVRRLIVNEREVSLAEMDAYRRFVKAIQEDYDAYVRLGRARLSPWNYQDAIWDLPYSDKDEAVHAYDDARAHYRNHEFDAEIASLRKAVEIDPQFTRAWLWLGDVYRARGKEAPALDAYRSAIKNNPKEPLSYKVLAYNLLGFRRWDDAISAWHQLIAVAPDDPDGHAGLGATLIAAKREREAVAPLEAAIALDPSREDLLVQLGLAYLSAGQPGRAIEAFHRGLQGEQPPSLLLSYAAYALVEANKELPLALDYAQRAVREEEGATAKATLATLKTEDLAHPTNLAFAWDTLGWVHARMGHLEKAQKYLEAAWSLSQSSSVGDHLAHVYERLHKGEQATHLRRLSAAAERSSDVISESRRRPPHATASGSTPASSADREELARLRTVRLPAITAQTASAEFLLLVGPGSKVVDAKFVSGDDALKKAAAAIKAAAVAAPFPDTGSPRIVRRGLVTCASMSGCSLLLYTPDLARSLE